MEKAQKSDGLVSAGLYRKSRDSLSLELDKTGNDLPKEKEVFQMTGTILAGHVLAGRYHILERLGEGGFAAVYKARDERFQADRVVALKEMSDENLCPSEREHALENFHREANLLVQLHHPHLPQVSDFFEEGGKVYLVMEFVEGKTLEQALDEAHGPLDEAVVMGWALQLCDVLHYLHSRPQPIIFRDLKPSNVMVTCENQLKLIDFGIARVFKAPASRDTTLLGSQGYAPLEQYGRGQSDPRSDIYALGATLYHLLTGSVPADAPTRRITPQLFALPRQLNPRLSEATEQILLMAMDQDPEERFQSAEAMQKAILEAAMEQVPPDLHLRKTSGADPSASPRRQDAWPVSSAGTMFSQEATPSLKTELERTILPLVREIGSSMYRAMQDRAANRGASESREIKQSPLSAQLARPSPTQMQAMAPLASTWRDSSGEPPLQKGQGQRGNAFVAFIKGLSSLVGLIGAVVFLLLVARFLLTFFQVSLGPFSFWVDELSTSLVAPFGHLLLPVSSSSHSIIDVSTIVAVVVYGIGFTLVRHVLTLLTKRRR